MAKISREWTLGVPETDVKRIEDTVLHSTLLLDRLRAIIHQRQLAIASSEATLAQYDTPNWDYRQAHLNGRKQELREFLELLKIHPDKG